MLPTGEGSSGASAAAGGWWEVHTPALANKAGSGEGSAPRSPAVAALPQAVLLLEEGGATVQNHHLVSVVPHLEGKKTLHPGPLVATRWGEVSIPSPLIKYWQDRTVLSPGCPGYLPPRSS